MSTLVLENVSKRYGSTTVLHGIDLSVNQGELVALLGPSGCGKTTSLRIVAGFVTPSGGAVRIGNETVTDLPAYARNTGMVFQSYALFPHMTVAANVGFGLEMRKVGRAERDQRIAEALKLVRLETLADRFPRELSGGQQQRVALARALVISPTVLLLDEPLSNLDAQLRAEVAHEIRSLQKRLGLTTLMVTHDQEEALAMADRLVVMQAGRVLQVGSAEDLYERPVDGFVANFVGRSNLLAGKITSPGAFCLIDGTVVPCNRDQSFVGPVTLSLRPERISISPSVNGDQLQATLQSLTYLGGQTEYRLLLGGEKILASASTPHASDPLRSLRPGQKVGISWSLDSTRLLPSTGAIGV